MKPNSQLQFVWGTAGPMAGAVSLVLIALLGRSWGPIPDLIFLGACAACVGGRWMDDPAIEPPRETYALGVGLMGVCLWAAARIIVVLF